MKKLSKNLISSSDFNTEIEIGSKNITKEKILQFGEGNFLRAFVDYLVDELNSNNLFEGGIVVVQPIAQGLIDVLNSQDGLYTLITRGFQGGKEINNKKIITSITRGINPYENHNEYFDCAKNPDLRFIVSNTTESGISFNSSDKLTDTPPSSFPAKVTALLYERYKIFNGDIDKGFIFIPCELIDNNGNTLKDIVLQYANLWNLEEGFISWVNNANYFTNTLVDRIVTGFPRDEIQQLTNELGYEDNLINTAEIFYFFVIEGPEKISNELPFTKINLNVVWTDDATNYKLRKVRMLNGAHTMSVFSAYLSGINTVGEMVKDELFKKYLLSGLFDEIIPTLDLPYEDLKTFAEAVFERFSNPFIKHNLLSISLNSVSKYKARVLPSILKYVERKKSLPKILTFSFATLLVFYRGVEIKDNSLIGLRGNEEYKIQDDENILLYFKEIWSKIKSENKDELFELVSEVCNNKDFWGIDLNTIECFSEKVLENLSNILTNGMESEVKRILC